MRSYDNELIDRSEKLIEAQREIKQLKSEIIELKREMFDAKNWIGVNTETQWGNNIVINIGPAEKIGSITKTQWGTNINLVVKVADASDKSMNYILEELKRALCVIKTCETSNENAREFRWNLVINDSRPIKSVVQNLLTQGDLKS